jgi:hypothetical protein
MSLFRIALSFFVYLRAFSDEWFPIRSVCICQTQKNLLALLHAQLKPQRSAVSIPEAPGAGLFVVGVHEGFAA